MKVKLKRTIRRLFYKGFTRKLYSKMSALKILLRKNLNDEDFIVKRFTENTGIKPNLENPKEYHEKVLWLKVHYRNPLMTQCSDKYMVREYVSENGYDFLLPKIYGAYKSFDDINFESLPNRVFIKTNHASGLNKLIEKNVTNLNKTKSFFEKALKLDYSTQSRERNYKNIKPLLIVEPYLDMNQYRDYKFFVFDGKVEFFMVLEDINDEKGVQSLYSKVNFYDKNLKLINDIDKTRLNLESENITFSKDLNLMIEAAEKLASPFPFCRVDFLSSKNETLFGEITFYPTGGNLVLSPKERSIDLGNKIDIKKIPSKYLV